MIDNTGYCGEQKVATFNGIGGSVTATVDEVERPAVIARNTLQPLPRGGFEITLNSTVSIPGEAYKVEFLIYAYYNMTTETNGKNLTFTTSDGDAVTGQTTLKSRQAIIPSHL